MSYSFHARGADKVAVKEKIKFEFDTVVQQQPIHARDRDAAQACAFSFVDQLNDGKDMDIFVTVYGSVSYENDGDIIGNNVAVKADYINRDTPQPK